MCVAIPARVVSVLGEGRALVEHGDRVREVSVLPVPDVAEGEYVLLNLGMAVQRLTEEEAAEVLEIWEQLNLSLIEEEEA